MVERCEHVRNSEVILGLLYPNLSVSLGSFFKLVRGSPRFMDPMGK